jgi:hypothetical protein
MRRSQEPRVDAMLAPDRSSECSCPGRKSISVRRPHRRCRECRLQRSLPVTRSNSQPIGWNAKRQKNPEGFTRTNRSTEGAGWRVSQGKGMPGRYGNLNPDLRGSWLTGVRVSESLVRSLLESIDSNAERSRERDKSFLCQKIELTAGI